jgi:inosine-uridine nucleoside N-ribohydrolase
MLKVIVDHDAGTNPDDCFGFALLAHLESIEILATISGNRYPRERACLAKRFFDSLGIRSRHLSGNENGCVEFFSQPQIEDRPLPPPSDYVDELRELIDQHDSVTYIAIQGLANLRDLLDRHPHLASKLKIFHMGLSLPPNGDWFDGGTNIKADSLAAAKIYSNPAYPIKAVGTQTTINDALRISPDTKLYRSLVSRSEDWAMLLLEQLEQFHQRRGIWPAMHDPVTVAAATRAYELEFEPLTVEFDDRGFYRRAVRGVVAQTSRPLSSPEHWFEWFTKVLTSQAY